MSVSYTHLDVYKRQPEWMREGVMYQIMVDRFYNGAPDGSLLRARSDVHAHRDWYERPECEIADNGDNVARDFFGGNLEGIRQKLPYLRDLGVTVLYLNPIFKARSNHKYDTGDYRQIDPMFGTEEDFSRPVSYTHLNLPVAVGMGAKLDVPVLEESPVCFELEVKRTIPLSPGSDLFICRIVNVLADARCADAENVESLLRTFAPVRLSLIHI